MSVEDPERILALLRDPNVDSQQVSAETGVTREEAARAARLLVTLAKALPEDVASLPPVLAAAVARAALATGRGDVLAALAGSADRGLAKEAKRGLHVLRARGVAVPEPPRAAPPSPPPPAEEAFPCYASSVDGHGERAVWISRNVPGRGVEVGQAVVSDVLGLLELQVGLLGRKEFRTFGRDIEARGRTMGVAQVDPGLAHALVAAARRLNDASGRRVPEGADGWLGRLGPADPLPDLAARFPGLGEEEEQAALAASGALHELPLLRGWLADEEMLRALAARLDALAAEPGTAEAGSADPGPADPAQRTERTREILGEAVGGYFDGPRRQRVAARLFAVAAHLETLGDAASARAAAAAARALRAGVAADAIPFARLLVEKAFPAAPPAGSPGR